MRAAGLFAAVSAAFFPVVAGTAHAADVRVGVGITVVPHGPVYVRQGYGYGHGRRPADTYRYGFDRGASEGSHDGYQDGRRGHRFELYREGDYRDADKGYKGWMGPRWDYARGYQRGYEQAYRQSFDQGRRECRDPRYRNSRYDRYDRYDDPYDYRR